MLTLSKPINKLLELWGDHDVTGYHHDCDTCPRCQEIIELGHKIYSGGTSYKQERLDEYRTNRYGEGWERRVIALHDGGYSVEEIKAYTGVTTLIIRQTLPRFNRKSVRPIKKYIADNGTTQIIGGALKLSNATGLTIDAVKEKAKEAGGSYNGWRFGIVRERGY